MTGGTRSTPPEDRGNGRENEVEGGRGRARKVGDREGKGREGSKVWVICDTRWAVSVTYRRREVGKGAVRHGGKGGVRQDEAAGGSGEKERERRKKHC